MNRLLFASLRPRPRAVLTACVASAAAYAAVVTHLGLLVFPTAILLIAVALPPALGLTSRFLAALAILFTLDTALAFLTLEPRFYALCWILPPAVVIGYRGLGSSVGVFRFEDALTTSAMTITSVVLLLPWASRDVSGQMAFMQPGEDNASHLGIISGIRSYGRLIYRASDADVPGVIPGLRTYPQGAHANVAIIANMVQGRTGLSGVASAVQAYSFAMAFSTAVMIVTLSVLSLRLAQAAGAPKVGWFVAVAVPLAAVLGGPALSLLSFGFFSQVVAYAALALLCALAADASWDDYPWWRLMVVGCCVVAVASSFYFLLPVLVLACLSVLWGARDDLRVHPVRGVVLAAITVGLSLPHVLASLQGGASSSLNANGGVRVLNGPALVLTVVGALLFLTRAIAVRAGRLVSTWAWTLITAIVFSVAFAKYQLSTVGATTYYFFKSLYTVQLFAIVALGAAGSLLIGRAPRVLATGGATLGLVAFLTVQSENQNSELHRSLYAAPHDDGFHATLDLRARQDAGLEPVLFWGFDDVRSDYNRNRQVGAAFLQDDVSRAAAVQASFRGQVPKILVVLIRAGHGLIVVTRDGSLMAKLASAGLSVDELATVHIQLLP